MWKRSDIRKDRKYYLSLDQLSNGNRVFTLHEVGSEISSPNTIFITGEVPNDLLAWRAFERISNTVKTIDGNRFFVDAHGTWLTQDEMDAIEDDVEDDKIPWLNGVRPNFSPK